MLNGARITKELRGLLWAEAANTATKHENMLVDKDKTDVVQMFLSGNHHPT